MSEEKINRFVFSNTFCHSDEVLIPVEMKHKLAYVDHLIGEGIITWDFETNKEGTQSTSKGLFKLDVLDKILLEAERG